MSEVFEVDLDAERVLFDGAWMTRDELAGLIKRMMESGDFHVARPGGALEQLGAAMSGAKVLHLRVSPQLAQAVQELASRTGRSPSAIARGALVRAVAENAAGGAAPSLTPAASQRVVAVTEPSPEEEETPMILTPKRRGGGSGGSEPDRSATPAAKEAWEKS